MLVKSIFRLVGGQRGNIEEVCVRYVGWLGWRLGWWPKVYGMVDNYIYGMEARVVPNMSAG